MDATLSGEFIPHKNVRVIITPSRGQVAQRAFGLSQVREPFVMQMDDDIIIEPITIAKLLDTLEELGPGNVVAPLYRNLYNGNYVTSHRKGASKLIINCYHSLVCGAPWGRRRMGKISAAGIGYWVDRELLTIEPFETEWVPGGCALCAIEDLVAENYFPFNGKAFSEDLIHSIFWRKQGIRLWAVPLADCFTEVKLAPINWETMWADFKPRAYVVRLIQGSMWRLLLWFVSHLAINYARGLTKILKHPWIR
jgi:glycosyltransferase involved in cell wall biosynthesis